MQVAAPKNRLRELRDERGVTLRRIAVACGVYESTVAYWQDHFIPHQHLATVAEILDVSVAYLAGWESAS